MMTVKELRKLLKSYPDNTPIGVAFGDGSVCCPLRADDICTGWYVDTESDEIMFGLKMYIEED